MSASSTAPSLRKLLGDERIPVFADLAECILINGAYKATKYLSPTLAIKATRKRYKAYKAGYRKGQNIDIVFTVGKPNYEEREVIRQYKKAGMAFPINHISEKFPG